ncbi:hypothetical protein [Kitasatospora sp. NPDC058190]|uniref:hypothetical protein n=1 Tax=Kitasatospora sp. NPDC058190 TaxID=3346371 RepID=UPI0036DF91B7
MTAPAVSIGDLVYDRRTKRLGVVIDLVGGRLYLRPPHGGIEWTARPEHVGPPPRRAAS